MIGKFANLDYKYLTTPTGDPFADTGGYVIKYLWENILIGKDIDELIDFATKIYVNNWSSKINSFFLNSKITQPSFNQERKIKETTNYFNALINNEIPYEIGYCRITGRKTNLFDAGRDNSLLSGSGTFVNFHHSFESGIKYSKEALIRMHFIPLGCIILSGRNVILSSNDNELTALFVNKNINANLSRIMAGINDGIVKSEFSRPVNALFDFVNYVIGIKEDYCNNPKFVSLTLYLFSNFGATPECEIKQLPAVVFNFYTFCLRQSYRNEWKRFINQHYFNNAKKSARYDAQYNHFIIEDEKGKTIIEENDFKTWANEVLDKLIDEKSITSNFLKWLRKGETLNFDIIRVYQQNIRNMKKETIDKIIEIADFIITDRGEDNLKKIISQLNGISKISELRRLFINLISENYKKEKSKPLITVKDYTDYLFSDSSNYLEIRDLILIAIYQKLHEERIAIEIENNSEEIV